MYPDVPEFVSLKSLNLFAELAIANFASHLRKGDDIVVEYSRPDFYGYSRIFVSRNNPEPAVVAVP